MNCPCGSGKTFSECCEVIISGQRQASSPEELMRSRYSAFATKNLAYLRESLDPQNWREMNTEANRQWAERATFTGLEILRSEESGNKGQVEFKANYIWEGEPQVHHELATFRKQQGRWFFKTGRVKENPK